LVLVENDFVATTKRLNNPQQTRIVVMAISFVTATAVIVVTLHIML